MPTLRGERFHIPLEDEDIVPDGSDSNDQPGFAAKGVLGDILERSSTSVNAPTAPIAPSGNASRGWPSHRKRYVSKQDKSKVASLANSASRSAKVENETFEDKQRREIDEENQIRLQSMSPEEIEAERRGLLAQLDPGLVERFLNRASTPRNADDQEISQRESRPVLSQRKVSFASPPQDSVEKLAGKTSAEKHSVALPSPPLNLAMIGTSPSLPHRVSSADRRVSFSVPQASSDDEGPSTAYSHSIPPTPPLSDKSETLFSSSGHRPSNTTRKVSFSVPVPEEADVKCTASRHTISTPSPTTTPCSEDIPKAKPKSERKVSFSLADAAPGERHSSAARHSISSTTFRAGNDDNQPPSSKTDRPLMNERRVSFAADVEKLDLDDDKITASRHSLPSTPQSKPVPDVEMIHEGVHFPRPDQPDLDPEAPSFLDDLHQKYFPNLAHDPSKLDWMQPMKPKESASYDPDQVDDIHPKDVRFDFRGQIIPPSKSRSLPTNLGLHNHALAPEAAGYTIEELTHLSRSAYPAQRCIAMQTMGRVLYRLGSGEFGNEGDIIRKDAEGQKAMLAKGLWEEVEEGRAIETISAEANKERGHQTSIAIAQEALWNWQRGGGRQPKEKNRGNAAHAI